MVKSYGIRDQISLEAKARISIVISRGVHFRFGSVFIKKSNQTELFFFKKTRNQIETGSNRPVSVWFFKTKTGSNWFGSVLARFGSVFFGSGSVRFGSVWFFQFQT